MTLEIVMLSVTNKPILLSVFMQNVVMLNILAPGCKLQRLVILVDCCYTHTFYHAVIDIKSLQNRLLKVCYVPTTSANLSRLPFCGGH